jgi:DNA-binding NarL/FixJ family response regulator
MLRHLLRDVFARNCDFEVAGEVEDLESLAAAVDATSPALVLVSVPESGGAADLCRRLLRHHPDLKVINLTTDSRHGYASRMWIQTRRLEEVSLESIISTVQEDSTFWDNLES